MVFHPKEHHLVVRRSGIGGFSLGVWETIGMVQLAADWGLDMKGKIHVDSSAAIGIAHGRGNGKLRHFKVG